MEILQGVWKQHLRLRAVVGYGVKTCLLSPPNYVTRSPGIKKQVISSHGFPALRAGCMYALHNLIGSVTAFLLERNSIE